MAVTFLTNVDKDILDGRINDLADRVGSRIVVSNTPPEDTNVLWIDIADTPPVLTSLPNASGVDF